MMLSADLTAVTADDVSVGGELVDSAWISFGDHFKIFVGPNYTAHSAEKLPEIAAIGRKLTEQAEARLAAMAVTA